MTARLGVRRGAGGSLVLGTRLRKRLGYAAGFVVLAIALALNLDVRRDFGPKRAPLTVLYGMLLAATLVAALHDRVLTVEPDGRGIRIEGRLAGRPMAHQRLQVAARAEVRLRRDGRVHVLEVDTVDAAWVVDTSSWRSDLEPMGKELAAALGLPFHGPPAGDRTVPGRAGDLRDSGKR